MTLFWSFETSVCFPAILRDVWSGSPEAQREWEGVNSPVGWGTLAALLCWGQFRNLRISLKLLSGFLISAFGVFASKKKSDHVLFMTAFSPLEVKPHYISQASLELLGTSSPLASASQVARATDISNSAQFGSVNFKMSLRHWYYEGSTKRQRILTVVSLTSFNVFE